MTDHSFINRLDSSVKRVRASIALAAAGALLALSPAQAEPSDSTAFPQTAQRVARTAVLPELFDQLGNAAEGGDVEAMNLLGVLYVANARVPSDYSMALYWFQRAVDRGSASAMHNMAQMYLSGLGVSRDYANGFRWFLRAAEGGNAYAMHSVAVMAERGLGTSRDLTLARSMYRKAAEAGVPLAMMWLSDDLSHAGKSQNLVEARAWLEVASLCELDGQLQIIVLARMEDLGNQLGPVGRDEARSQAARIVAAIRSHAASEAPSIQSPRPSDMRFPSA